ncbi:haloacid dehalogenase superfamily enzyme, subfamily IA [Bernardetia litoralis DSM 6794]|uniref:Haloacid dehalogenase superfamily enzyme, subfamily IA n=1 Tax=Bernardetia litoralis (strain ATCC 23117 / DSM 6794 / NBRC 15988 / NCIMB 1366 / Fx l1 / Sio-4) TaxID=880071 RepID=I4AHB9_BERLS|nr:HAD family hydrolase [Bernardetia litoralis]AFM03354.1 haloacid dehalogenase superfamily enzyme, subfamily IA [Bernardetia litoralis DSM 6794]
MNTTKIIVFDLYNTLIKIKESTNFFLKLFRSSKNGFDLEISAYLRLVMTVNIDELLDILPQEFATLYKKNINELEKELDSIFIYDEIFDVLEDLKKDFRLFLISNLASPYKKPVFKLGLDNYFEEMIFSCDYGYLKPNDEIFEEIEKITTKKSNEILMVGDSLKSDIVGARNMKWNYLRIKRSGNILENYEIKSLKEMRKFI